ncbi:hypothetical protein [Aestuariibaculum sediminum]|uniref:Uncharacterized protein n=1 Tax=Aestuariibaculum sediminum TaxID=2770637 RepID=A0A8J6Q2L9_9FLAO|nr:hypothetical protein [Aestuariibaculum sediminum]MBD0831925.1 hypothetical protein [Aestuariibaculum sediminum]
MLISIHKIILTTLLSVYLISDGGGKTKSNITSLSSSTTVTYSLSEFDNSKLIPVATLEKDNKVKTQSLHEKYRTVVKRFMKVM